MSQPYSTIVRTPKAAVAYLAVDLRTISPDTQANLSKLIGEFADLWAYKTPQQRPATLWMKDNWATEVGSSPELHLAGSSKLPHGFLHQLADHISRRVETPLRVKGHVIIEANDDWHPICHWQDGKAWSWNDLQHWSDRDQSPAAHDPSSLAIDQDVYFGDREPKHYSAQQLNTRAFKTACESGDKEDLGEHLQEQRYILGNTEAYENGNTPLHLAAAAGDLEACEALLRFVPDNVLNERQQTPLIYLADIRGKHPHGAVVSRLQSTVDFTDAKGRTALMYAARGAHVRSRLGHLTLVKALLSAGAEITTIDSDGLTALGWAKKDLSLAKPDANSEVVDYLQRHLYQVEMERFFRTHYTHHFNTKGVMQIEPVNRSSLLTALNSAKGLTDVVECPPAQPPTLPGE
ncbi:ankyrin repeat domain-containing protein [Pseudomonas kermanshahensis]|uniref:ankyrin repeat domain-containing protein n=1 Tax=Pseudomonas kermanshahensis TaxID=2745482 RepID=UPI0020936913|nr:ankyrin repeat domain-containing protein [Pseudomonas kermanshahensis]USS55426.1 ankyrin repeat domain-containing protein [Pseudomonas kermanshahensis]